MKTTITKPSICPVCFYKMDSHSSIETEAKPKTGDISMCIKCGILLEFENPETLIRIKPETLKAIKKDPEIWGNIVRSQNAINELRI